MPLMKLVRRCQRILILSLLSISVFAPIVLVSHRLKTITSIGRKEFIEDLSNIRYRKDAFTLNAIEQEAGESLREPKLVVYEDKDFPSVVSYRSSNEKHNSDVSRNLDNIGGSNHDEKEEEDQPIYGRELPSKSGEKEPTQTTGRHDQNERSQSRRVRGENIRDVHSKESNQMTVRSELEKQSKSQKATDIKVKDIKDQVVRAKAYLSFAPPGSNTHLVKELKLRIKELERATGEARKDSDLSRSALQKMRHMESSLLKANRIFPDCSVMASKLRAMTHNAEEQVRAQKNQGAYLLQLSARTTPKGLHCLSMRLTAEYFALQPEDRQLPNHQRWHDPELKHYAVFSDNVLACAVVVNSTVSSAMDPEKIVFHVVTDSLNFPAISMWFLLNPPGKAVIHVQSMDNLEWLSKEYDLRWKKQNSTDPRFTSELNHLRFYLPKIFPTLNKIVLLDHDVVVQRDLSGLWSLDMNGKVISAVETCREGEPSFHRMNMFINFSDPAIARKFDVNACTWAFGMNLFDLTEWRKHNLIDVYHKFLQLGSKRPIFKLGTLPLGWVTFYNHAVSLDRQWQILGLGYDSGIKQYDIEKAAVIHFDGVRKPWLDIVFGRYKNYWSKYVNYEHSYLQQCNIHG